MNTRWVACALGAAMGLSGCATPFDATDEPRPVAGDAVAPGMAAHGPSDDGRVSAAADAPSTLGPDAGPEEYVRYALDQSPRVQAAYQRWKAAAAMVPQARALPDPRLNFGFFLDEVETRVGPQQARVGVSQMFPWPGTLAAREDAAALAARAAWRQLQAAQLSVAAEVVGALHELAYLDEAVRITRETLGLLASFEEVARARYRVGAGSHPALVRVQVELGQMEDRLRQLEAMRPAFVAELNAALGRAGGAAVAPLPPLPALIADAEVDALVAAARDHNPTLLALGERVEEQRVRTTLARKSGLPDLTVGVDYTFTGEAMMPGVAESGDDPILLSFGLNVPLWREKYDAAVREAVARRLAVAHERGDETNRLDAAVHRAWFEHTDAQRRLALYEQTLIPRAQESLRTTLAGFRAGDASFLDLLDTERTLLEFALSSARARADRGRSLARLQMLVGGPVPLRGVEAPAPAPAPASPADPAAPEEVQP